MEVIGRASVVTLKRYTYFNTLFISLHLQSKLMTTYPTKNTEK